MESGPHGLRVAAASDRAKQLGIQAGLRFGDAKARAPDLISEPIDREADATALKALGFWLIRVAPLVGLDGPDGLLLETTGCEHLYGGEEGLMAEMTRLLNRDGLAHQMALAGTPTAAIALARTRPGTCLPSGQEARGLARLPISALRLNEEAGTLLRRFGLTQIGQLYDIDRKALARRFPSKSAADAVLLKRDQALGQRSDPIHPLRPAAARTARLPCPEPIASTEALQYGLTQLTEEICTSLAEHGEGARGFCLRAFRSDGTQDQLAIRLARPVRTPAHILRLFGERLDQIDPGFGIDLLLLEALRTGPMDVSAMALSGNLAASDSDPVALAALADRITARLGPDTVRIRQPQASYLPERAEQDTVFEGTLPDLSPPGLGPSLGPRPLRLLQTPERVQVLAEVPDGPPQRFVWRRLARQVSRADGPERISPEWWHYQATPAPAPSAPGTQRDWLSPKMDPRADAAQIAKIRTALEQNDSIDDPGELARQQPRARDYYRVEDNQGRRYWLFREGLYGDGRGGLPDWYVHGFFA